MQDAVHRIRFWLTFALLTLVVGAHAMNGIAQIGYGTKSRGMGGVGIAFPQDAFASANNPAGLTCVGTRFDGGLHWLRQNGHIDVRPTESAQFEVTTNHSSGRNIIWPEAGVVWKFCPSQSLGLAIFAYGGFDTLYRPVIDDLGVEHTGMEFKQFFVTPSWAWDVGCQMSIGIAVNVCFAWTSVKGLRVLMGLPPEPMTSSECPAYSTNRGTDHEEGLSLRFGWRWQLGRCLSLGLTYQTPTWLNRFKNYKGFVADRGDLDLPGQVGAGLAYTPWRCVTIAVDVSWINWKDSAQFGNADQQGGNLYGAHNGPGFGWDNRLVIKTGIAYTFTPCVTVRAGWNWSKIPFHADQLLLNILNLGMIEHHFTVGGSYCFGCNELSICYVHGLEKGLRTEATNINPVVSLCGYQFAVGLAFGRKF